MDTDIPYKIKSMSLKWKLLIPFLFLSFVGTTSLVFIGLRSQQVLIKKEEQKEIENYYHLFLSQIQNKKDQALSLSSMIAQDTRVQRLLSNRNRKALAELLVPLYEKLSKRYAIQQFHLHIPPGKSFLRLHLPQQPGEMIAYRKTIMEAMKTGKAVGGLEWGLTGLGIRGVVPIYQKGSLVGSVEFGFSLSRSFLDDLKKEWGPDFSVFEKRDPDTYVCLATTLGGERQFSLLQQLSSASADGSLVLISPPGHAGKIIFLGPLKDFLGNVVGRIQIDVDRTPIERRLAHTTRLMVLVGAAGVVISFLLTWFVASRFIRPITEIVGEAQEIAEGKRARRLESRAEDEIGDLTQSLNTMLEALKEREIQIQEYAKNLEKRVEERTADLVSSEEKYRTLVENLPLVVYRILDDGTTEFVNPHFTDKLGYTAEEAVGDKRFWQTKICSHENGPGHDIWHDCWANGRPFRVERTVRDKEGYPLTFIDHAIPNINDEGKVDWVDGIMVDITELKRLQERAIRTEEIRVLGEISARFAHEIRNPLATAGGFARRLEKALPLDDPHRKTAQIIVEEVARLEEILQIILSSIEPLTLSIAEVDLKSVLTDGIKYVHDHMEARGIRLSESIPETVPPIQGDEGLLGQAIEALVHNAVNSMPEGETLWVSLVRDHDHLVVTLRYGAKGLAEEDLEHFFFPRCAGQPGCEIHNLPLAKIIIHRHGGSVLIFRDREDKIVLKIELPVRFLDSSTGSKRDPGNSKGGPQGETELT